MVPCIADCSQPMRAIARSESTKMRKTGGPNGRAATFHWVLKSFRIKDVTRIVETALEAARAAP
ncbi:hypothetical protein GCM10025759_15500 [Lysobacter panacisoli]|uniref:Uncharacterized protein n=1 Tax=Lysobacter panacisoli TaxID=1255263 RepID=A0ABP9LCI1_9GAMM